MKAKCIVVYWSSVWESRKGVVIQSSNFLRENYVWGDHESLRPLALILHHFLLILQIPEWSHKVETPICPIYIGRTSKPRVYDSEPIYPLPNWEYNHLYIAAPPMIEFSHCGGSSRYLLSQGHEGFSSISMRLRHLERDFPPCPYLSGGGGFAEEECELAAGGQWRISQTGGDSHPSASAGRGAPERVLLIDSYFHSSNREFKVIKLTYCYFAADW